MSKKQIPHVLQKAYLKGFANSEGAFLLFAKDEKGNITYTITNNTNNRIFRSKKYFSDSFDQEFIKPLEDWFGGFIHELRNWTPLHILLEREDRRGKKNIISMIEYLVMQYFRNERNFEILGTESLRRSLSVEEIMRLRHEELVNRFLDSLYSKKLFVEIKMIDKGIDGEHAKQPFHFITGDFPFHVFDDSRYPYKWKGETFFPLTSKLGILFTTNIKRVSPIPPGDRYRFISRMNYLLALNCGRYLVSPVGDFCGVEVISDENSYWKGIIHAKRKLDGPRSLLTSIRELILTKKNEQKDNTNRIQFN